MPLISWGRRFDFSTWKAVALFGYGAGKGGLAGKLWETACCCGEESKCNCEPCRDQFILLDVMEKLF